MPQTDFFCDSDDERSLISFIFGERGWLVASNQAQPTYKRIDTWDAYDTARRNGGGKWALENEKLFFVLFDLCLECPLEVHLIEAGYYKGTYSVTQRVGGPVLDLLMSTICEKDGVNQISDGALGYYPTYRNTLTGDMEKTNQDLINQYRSIVKYFKQNGVTIEAYTGRKYAIGSHTLPRIQSGELKIGVHGLKLPPDLRT